MPVVGVFGLPGATVPANGMVLKLAAIRGVESNGMMCSTRELELGDDHDGIIELPDGAPVGTDFADYAGLTDPVIDVSITPNRQDCMGVRGIARDLSAAGLGTLKPLSVIPAEAGIQRAANAGGDMNSRLRGNDGVGPGPDIKIEDPEAAPPSTASRSRA